MKCLEGLGGNIFRCLEGIEGDIFRCLEGLEGDIFRCMEGFEGNTFRCLEIFEGDIFRVWKALKGIYLDVWKDLKEITVTGVLQGSIGSPTVELVTVLFLVLTLKLVGKNLPCSKMGFSLRFFLKDSRFRLNSKILTYKNVG